MRNARCLKKNQSGACKAVILILRQITYRASSARKFGRGKLWQPSLLILGVDGMFEFLRYILPNQSQIEWGSMSAIVGTGFTYLCGWNGAVEALLWLMVIDYISGVAAAYVNPNLALNSQRGFKGIVKKMMILLLVSLAHFVDKAVGQILAQTIVVWFFIGNEGLSVVENAAKAGLPVPEKLRATLEQLKEHKG